LERAIHAARATRKALTHSRGAVRRALAHYVKTDSTLERALHRVHGVAHPSRLVLKRFAEPELGELRKLERELVALRPFVPKRTRAKAKKRKARK
jgi:hypothetical protein